MLPLRRSSDVLGFPHGSDGSTFQFHRISMVGVFVPLVYAVVIIQGLRFFFI